MPVTARLSKQFYDRFGEQVTNELVDWFNQVDATYKADLRELNELNFARFDAKMDQQIERLRSEFKAGLGELRSEMKAGFGELRGELKAGLSDARAEQVRWMFLSWATLMAAILALR